MVDFLGNRSYFRLLNIIPEQSDLTQGGLGAEPPNSQGGFAPPTFPLSATGPCAHSGVF